MSSSLKSAPGIPALAACAGSRITPEGAGILADRNVKLLKVNGDKNAADDRLLKEVRGKRHRSALLPDRRGGPQRS